MAKRRTRKQKEKAKHQFKVSWKPEAKSTLSEPVVKGQTEVDKKAKKRKGTKRKKAYYKDNSDNLGTIKRDLVKSLIIASLILALEVVLYLA